MPAPRRSPSILPRQLLCETGELNHGSWIYRPFLGRILRIRFRMVQNLLAGRHYRRLLEVGYGSGVLMPELAQHCRELYGIDLHRSARAASRNLAGCGVHARLCSASAAALPFAERSFDAVVAVSTLEFIGDLVQACREIRRVLTGDGIFVVVTPGFSPLVDAGFRLLTGRNPKRDFGAGRRLVVPTLLSHFAVVDQTRSGLLGTARSLRLYTGLRLQRPGADQG